MAKEKNEVKVNAEEMLQAGCHFGHRVSVTHPKMKPFIFGSRNAIQIIDLEKTAPKFEAALDFIYSLVKEGKVLLLVGTKIQTKQLVAETARAGSWPYVSERWLGGTFTNLEVIRKRIHYLQELEAKKGSPDWEKYTKKERMKMEREMAELKKRFGGILAMEKLPEAIFICDLKHDATAVREARAKKVPVIGIVDTNIDPDLADYPIPANDDAISSVRYILGKVKETALKAKDDQ